jgi:solute carrier family 13 (sodium-dependent dicarboxylate transporter), member 2/3/5
LTHAVFLTKRKNFIMHREHHDENEKGGLRRSYWIGLILAPILALLAYVFMPSESLNESGEVVAGLSHNGRAVVAIAVLMATLWVTEALPLAVTALLPIVMFPLFTGGAIAVRSVTTAYGHDLIYLYLGGFMIAMAMQRWGLHRRIALHTVLFFGTQPARLVAGFMVATAFLSMWVSNTATTVMMMPIAMSVVELVRRELIKSGDPNFNPDHKHFNFAICLMLGIAYAASIGGIGTLIGTGTNALVAAFLKDNYQIEISFAKWMLLALPLVVTFLPITWLLLTRVIFPIRIRHIPGGRELIHNELKSQGPISRAELMVLIIFCTTGFLWMIRPLLAGLQMPGGCRPLAGLSDAGISLTAAVTLFCLPVDREHGRFLLTWQQAVKLPWGIIILLGGGLALAYAIKTTGVAEFIGCTVSDLKGLPLVVLIMMVCATVIFVTELSSNVATVSAFGPIFAAVAVGLGISPLLLIIPTAIAASCAFMMPVATPPNAIVFSSGEITIPQMCKAGLFLNIVGIGLVTLLIYFVAIPLLSIKV